MLDCAGSSLSTPEDLLDRLVDGKFEFSLRGWKAPAAPFFAPTIWKDEILTERRHWLAEAPSKHLFYLPAAGEFVDEVAHLAHLWNPAAEPAGSTPQDLLQWLGETWEADILIMKPDNDKCFHFVAGVICFPSSWAPEEKIGLPVGSIHSPVPGLNEAIGEKIDRLLERLPPGQAWLRVNWGLSLKSDRNQHPFRHLPRINVETPPENLWLRLEYQALVRLPRTGGILFGIQLFSFPAHLIRSRPQTAQTIAHHLVSMPEAMRRYKNIHPIADQFAAWLISEDSISVQ